MTIWHVHRREDGSIASAHGEPLPGYAEEVLDDAADAELQAFFAAASGPVSVSRLRLKLELAERGLLASVEAAVQAGGTLPRLYWAEATNFESNHPLVAQIGAAVGLSGNDIRALFKAAAEREA